VISREYWSKSGSEGMRDVVAGWSEVGTVLREGKKDGGEGRIGGRCDTTAWGAVRVSEDALHDSAVVFARPGRLCTASRP